MSKYFYDTEFLEGPQNKTFLDMSIGKTKPTIDLISIGIVDEEGREFYAISKDFNLKEAWNRYDKEVNRGYPVAGPEYFKKYWIRENVLRPVWQELCYKDFCESTQNVIDITKEGSFELFKKECLEISYSFTYKNIKKLLNKYGNTNKQISEDIKIFIKGLPEFYGYYSAYDHVVFCWLFGLMKDLPEGFPMYSRDLKQIMDEKEFEDLSIHLIGEDLKNHPKYPKQDNEHNALSDARWNKKLYEFLKSL